MTDHHDDDSLGRRTFTNLALLIILMLAALATIYALRIAAVALVDLEHAVTPHPTSRNGKSPTTTDRFGSAPRNERRDLSPSLSPIVGRESALAALGACMGRSSVHHRYPVSREHTGRGRVDGGYRRVGPEVARSGVGGGGCGPVDPGGSEGRPAAAAGSPAGGSAPGGRAGRGDGGEEHAAGDQAERAAGAGDRSGGAGRRWGGDPR